MSAPDFSTTSSKNRVNRSSNYLTQILLVLLVLVGFSLRIWQLDTKGLDHFDEGVYVFTALGLTDSTQPYRLYPEQVKFSPPVYFSLAGLAYLLYGVSDFSAMVVNVFLGTLTIAVVWRAGRSWFGPAAGAAAAAFLALSEYHIAFSRMALTDIAYALVFLLALLAIAAAIRRQSLGWAIGAGLVVGLAWNTKYHGWFALVAAGAALVPYSFFQYRRNGHIPYRNFFLWGVMAAIAALCYVPWALFVQAQPGGYAELAQYQRTLLSRHWLGNLWQQVQQQVMFEGPFSRGSVLAALAVVLLIAKPKAWTGLPFWLLVALLGIFAILVGGAGAAALLALGAIPFLLGRTQSFPAWLLLSWLGLWFFSTPLYHPYARLVLPFTIATYLAAGAALQTLVARLFRPAAAIDWKPVLATGLAGVIVAALVVLWRPDMGNPWLPTRSVPEAAQAMAAIIPPNERVIVIGEPTLAYYLHLAGRPAFDRLEDIALLAQINTPTYLVTGVYSKRAPTLRDGLAQLEHRLVPLGVFAMEPGDVRLIDDHRPDQVYLYRNNPDNRYEFSLYQLVPQSSSIEAKTTPQNERTEQ